MDSQPSAVPEFSSAPPVHLAVEALTVRYPGIQKPVVQNLSFALARGDIGCLLGASGCGKTTLLRAVAGFITPQAGRIVLGNYIVASANQQTPPELRKVGMVFQDFALFPHLTVAKNIAFGLAGLDAAQRLARVTQMLELADLASLAKYFPHELSGGQQQRVALARALAPAPEILLLDEPFSSLDVDLRERLSLEVRSLIKHTGTTALMVTHDQREAFAMADVIGVMHEGRIEQWDTPYNLYHRPATRYVADFVGEGSFVPGELHEPHGHDHKHVHIELGWITPPDKCNHPHLPPQPVDVLLRPDDVVHDDQAPLQGVIVRKAFRGADFLYTLRLASGRDILALVPSHHDHAVGESIGIRLEADHVVTFERTSQ